MSISQSWQRIIRWHESNTPPKTLSLNSGATPEQVGAFEEMVGVDLPADLKESMLLHDGGDGWLLWFGDFMPLAAIAGQWSMYCDWQDRGDYAVPNSDDWLANAVIGAIKPIFWNRKRIYVTDNSGNHLTVDLDPPAEGCFGQLIDHCHVVGPQTVVAKSWTEFLETTAERLENGRYFYSEDDGQVEDRI